MFVNRPLIFLIAGVLCAWLPAKAQSTGSDPSAERWSVHFQATSIGQHHGSFPSLYEGENSLPSHPENRVSLTATVFLRSGGGSHLLVGDDARNRRENVHYRRGTILVRAEDAETVGGSFHGDSGLIRDILGDFQILLGDSALIVQELGTGELRARQSLIGDRLPVVRESRGSIGALHAQQELPLGHGIAQPGMDFQNAAGRQGDHGNISRDIGGDGSGHVQNGYGIVLAGCGDGKLFGVVHFDEVGIALLFHLRGLGRAARRIARSFGSAAGQKKSQGERGGQGGVGRRKRLPHKACVFHWMTSVPTAMLDRKSTRLNSSHLGISY